MYRVVVDTIDSSIGGTQEQGQGFNVAVLDCEGHELHALCGAMTLLMQVRDAAAVFLLIALASDAPAAAALREKVFRFL